MSDAVAAHHLWLALHTLARCLTNLLSWCDHPAPTAPGEEWLKATRNHLRESVGSAIDALRGTDVPVPGLNATALLRTVDRACSDSLALVALLCDRPALATVPRHEWPSAADRTLYEEIAAAARQLAAAASAAEDYSAAVTPAARTLPSVKTEVTAIPETTSAVVTAVKTVDKPTWKVLECLNEKAPRLLVVADIAAATRYGRKTVEKAVKTLMAYGYADRPQGDRSGATITSEGKKVLADRL